MKLADSVGLEATKLVRRYESYAYDQEDRTRRITRRTGTRPIKSLYRPGYWSIASGFDPYHVRSHAESIGYALEKAIVRHDYSPRSALEFPVPKLGGGTRTVSVFQVADSALSRVVFRQLLNKNSSAFSAHSYAYRTDRTLHDAVRYIASEFRGQKRLFMAEFDFRKYFDSISHDHLLAMLSDNRFFVTATEREIVEAFLRTPTLPHTAYTPSASEPRAKGIPQGTSISLFLANLAAHPLDRRLERLGVGFARFADDTLIWSDDYSSVCKAVEALEDASREMGVDINLEKSAGISILAPEGAPAEFRSKTHVDFVGHRISLKTISIRGTSLARIKSHLSHLIYTNLLQAPRANILNAQRLGPSVDRDYVVMLFQIRRYLYGDLGESGVRRYLARGVPKIRFRGLMSFYPMIDDEALLRGLDGWLLHTVYTSVRTRARLLAHVSSGALPPPHGLTKSQLLAFIGRSSKGGRLDLRLPSFSRMASLLRQASSVHGANAIANTRTLYGASTPGPSGRYGLVP